MAAARLRMEAQVDIEHLKKAADQQARAHQQHAGEGDLRDHQRAANPARALASVEPRLVSFSASCRAAAGNLQRGRQAEDQAGEHRHGQREAERRLRSVRTLGSSGMLMASRCASARVPATGEQHAQRRAAAGKRHALREHLADQPPLSRAQRRADGDFLLSRRGPRQQQVREIGAHNQHDHADRACQHHQRRPDAAADVLREKAELSFESRCAPDGPA